jgi:hypothetical protein
LIVGAVWQFDRPAWFLEFPVALASMAECSARQFAHYCAIGFDWVPSAGGAGGGVVFGALVVADGEHPANCNPIEATTANIKTRRITILQGFRG